MTSPVSAPNQGAVRLRAALEATAAALAQPSLEGLLAAEDALRHATARLSALTLMADAERIASRAELEAAAVALARCRRLGATLDDFVRISLDVRGQATRYDGSTHATAEALAGRGFQARV